MNHREQLARQTLADVMKKLYSRGLISVYGGNASMVLSDDNALLITPSGFNKENLREEDLVKVDFVSGEVLGEGKPSSELKTHISVYKANSTVHAVVHAHPPTLVGCAPADLILVFTHLSRHFWLVSPWLSIFVWGKSLRSACLP